MTPAAYCWSDTATFVVGIYLAAGSSTMNVSNQPSSGSWGKSRGSSWMASLRSWVYFQTLKDLGEITLLFMSSVDGTGSKSRAEILRLWSGDFLNLTHFQPRLLMARDVDWRKPFKKSQLAMNGEAEMVPRLLALRNSIWTLRRARRCRHGRSRSTRNLRVPVDHAHRLAAELQSGEPSFVYSERSYLSTTLIENISSGPIENKICAVAASVGANTAVPLNVPRRRVNNGN